MREKVLVAVSSVIMGFALGVFWTITNGAIAGRLLQEVGKHLIAAEQPGPEIVSLDKELAFCLDIVRQQASSTEGR